MGRASYGTITGWYRSEMGSIYGPLLIAAVAIIGASASTAGEEEDGSSDWCSPTPSNAPA